MDDRRVLNRYVCTTDRCHPAHGRNGPIGTGVRLTAFLYMANLPELT